MSDQVSLGRAAREADLIYLPDAKAPLLTRKPFVLTVHDLFFIDHPEWFPPAVRTYKRRLLSAALRRGPRSIVCVSEHTRERLRVHHPQVFDRCPVEVIYPGIEAPAECPDGKPEAAYFLTVSGLAVRKNHLGLLSAFAAARRQGLDLRWKVAGPTGDPNRPVAVRLRATEGVDVLGRVSDQRLEQLYRGAQFVATPSFAEGFGFPPLEAMIRGVPVISSTGSALDETVGSAGLRVAPTDGWGWTEALLRLASDRGLRDRLRQAGLDNVKRFSWATAARRHLELFRRLGEADVVSG
jgi:glycosyltransferase involved in cell wall biosynthesis